MDIKHIKLTFSLLFISTLSVMGMEKYPTFKETQNLISNTIEKKSRKYLGMPLDEQEKLVLRGFEIDDIKKIAETDIDKGILLEQHYKNVKTIETYSPNQRNNAIKFMLEKYFDRQQTILRLIECAHFILSPAVEDLIRFALDNNLIPEKLLETRDTTPESFDRIDALYNNNSKLMEKILPKKYFLELKRKFYFGGMTKEIKRCQYNLTENRHSYVLMQSGRVNFEDIPLVNATDIPLIKNHFETTSLCNKIELIIKLHAVTTSLSRNIARIKMENKLTPYIVSVLTYFITSSVFVPREDKISKIKDPKTKAIIISLFGSILIFPPIIAFYLFRPSAFTKDLEVKKQLIKNLIEEFKESIKKKYKN